MADSKEDIPSNINKEQVTIIEPRFVHMPKGATLENLMRDCVTLPVTVGSDRVLLHIYFRYQPDEQKKEPVAKVDHDWK